MEDTISIANYSGPWTRVQTAHFLKRTTIGFKKEELEELASLGINEVVNRILEEPPEVEPPVNNYRDYLGREDPNVAVGEPWVFTPITDGVDFPRRLSYLSWIYDNMINHSLSVHEKMVLFWHNHLVSNSEDLSILSYQYMDLLRTNALGNFKDLMLQITLNPRMLNYLNGSRNIASQPDENYSRELQELFCIGKGPNSNYTENDVREAARVLTGWYNNYEKNLNGNVPIPEYWEGNHDSNDKVFSEFYGFRRIEGREGPEGGYEEIQDLIEMIFDNEETSLHICRKLFRFFVYSEISEEVETNFIQPLAQLFRNSNYEIKPVLEAIFLSEAFFDESFRGALVKSPAEFLLGTWRSLKMDYQDPTDQSERFFTCLTLKYYTEKMGMDIGEPPNVAGWSPYYQEPLKDKSWISTDTITYRARITDMIANQGLYVNNNGTVVWLTSNLVSFVEGLNEPDNVYSLIDECVELFLGLPLSEDQIADLRSILLSGQDDDYYWWDAWNSYLNFPENDMFKTTVENRLKPFFRVLFQYSEFNLM